MNINKNLIWGCCLKCVFLIVHIMIYKEYVRAVFEGVPLYTSQATFGMCVV